MQRIDRRHLLPGAAAFAAALLVALLGLNAGADAPESKARAGTVELQLLGVNDFHGHLEPPEPDVGGAIEATNQMGFDVGTLGNHEFDEGGAEALRLVHLAHYPYIAANTVTREGDDLILPPYKIVERAGVKVGFIGVTTTDTPYFLLSEYARQFRWTDLSDAVNRYVPALQRQGVQAIVVLAHAGAFQQGDDAAGEVVDEARQMDPAVDVVVAGHTHSRLNLDVDGKLVVEALSYGVAFDRVTITVDRATGDVVDKSALVMPTRHEGIKPDPDLLTLVESYRKRVAPLANRVVGYTDDELDNDAVDRVAVDAQRAFAGADIAFLNPGNTRSDIDAGPITYSDAFEVQAYEHPVWRLHMLGADLLKVEAEQPGLLVSGPSELRPDVVYTVAANGIVAGRPPFDAGTDREKVGTDLQALVAWLQKQRRITRASGA
jgi:5'-nucleotidase